MALGGAVPYVGMYVQSSLALIYVAITVGTVLLIVGYLLSLRTRVSNPAAVGWKVMLGSRPQAPSNWRP